MWSMAQRPQTTVQVLRPDTVAETGRPRTQSSFTRQQTGVQLTRPQTGTAVVYPATTVEAVHPVTTVETIHPQTNVEVIHPQTVDFTPGVGPGQAGQKGGKSAVTSSAKATTSMSDFTPKQAKDFAAAQKAAPIGGGENKLGNDTDAAEKDAANKASSLGKQSNQNIDIDPKASNLAGLNKAVEQQVNEKKKKK